MFYPEFYRMYSLGMIINKFIILTYAVQLALLNKKLVILYNLMNI